MRVIVSIRREPASVDDHDPAAFDLENNHAVPRVEEDEVGFAVALTATAKTLPAHLMEDVPIIRQRLQRVTDA
jgi:hypothetical protein